MKTAFVNEIKALVSVAISGDGAQALTEPLIIGAVYFIVNLKH
jgi:hypothetical protein